jgi:hypothetical protein
LSRIVVAWVTNSQAHATGIFHNTNLHFVFPIIDKIQAMRGGPQSLLAHLIYRSSYSISKDLLSLSPHMPSDVCLQKVLLFFQRNASGVLKRCLVSTDSAQVFQALFPSFLLSFAAALTSFGPRMRIELLAQRITID